MSITAITRDWGTDPSIVRITSTDTLAVVGTTGYLLAQDDEIKIANFGAFQFNESDMVLVYASDGWAFFTPSTDFESLNLFVQRQVVAPSTIASGQFTPTITLPGGSQWNLTGASAKGTYLRIGNYVSCQVSIDFPNGTSGTGQFLGVRISNLPFTIDTSGPNITGSGASSAVIFSTNPANGNAVNTGAIGATSIDVNIIGYASRAGTSANEHFVNVNFNYPTT